MGSDERDRRGNRGEKQVNARGSAARGEEDAGGQQRHQGGMEPYRLPRPIIRELMEGRPAGADDGEIPPKGYLGRPS